MEDTNLVRSVVEFYYSHEGGGREERGGGREGWDGRLAARAVVVAVAVAVVVGVVVAIIVAILGAMVVAIIDTRPF